MNAKIDKWLHKKEGAAQIMGSLFFMQFNFFYDQYIEELNLIRLFQEEDPLGIDNRANQIGFLLDLALDIQQKPLIEWREKLQKEVSSRYHLNMKKIEADIISCQSYWRETNYIQPIEDVLIKKIPNYYILLSQYNLGVSDWYGTSIVVPSLFVINHNMKRHTYVVLFEVLLSQLFMKIRLMHPCLMNWDIWLISELGTFTILHNIFDEFLSVEKTGYREVDELIPKADYLYKNTKNIDEFIENIILFKRKK